MENNGIIGVVVGRFQVHELHEAHEALIRTVIQEHSNVVIFLGCAVSAPEKKNGLNFRSRELMFREIFGNDVIILPITDKEEDVDWSKQLDSKLAEIFPGKKAILYGSRDSFIPHYKGKHPVKELESKTMISGTEIRRNISDKYLGSKDWRAGVISAFYSTYDKVYPTVDVAIYKAEEEIFLFGRKPNQNKMRFIGGFIDTSDLTFEQAGKREVREETCCEVDGLEYICSLQIDDWRYRRVADKITTTFFLGYYVHGPVAPADDIAELYWKKLEEITDDMFVPEHIPLLHKLKEFMVNKKRK